MSIQLKLGGHSFSADTLPAAADTAETVEIVVLTDKTLLIPGEEFEPSLAGSFLRLAGMACNTQETPVWSDPEAPIVAVMAADTEDLAILRNRLDDRAVFTTPLLFPREFPVPTVWLYRADRLLYIKVRDSVLRFAEAVIAETEADVVYYVERLSKEFLFSAFTACAAGTNTKETLQILKNYFPRVVCE